MQCKIFSVKQFKLAAFISIMGLLGLCVRAGFAEDAWTRITRTRELRWGADATGGAPYVFPDAANPSRLIGFEIDIIEALARQLHVKPVLVQVQWDQIVPALQRGDFDMAFNGLEVTPDRQAIISFSHPYYLFSQQITVRHGDRRFSKFEDLRGHRVGTLSATLAQKMIAADPKIIDVPYPSPVETYKDLEIGRTDAVLLDVPIAAWYAGPNPKLENVGNPIGLGQYAGGIRKDSPELLKHMNEALGAILRSGELRKIYEKWHMWDENQLTLSSPAGSSGESMDPRLHHSGMTVSLKYLPLLFKGAATTVVLSFCSMVLAVLLGFGLCLGKMYGSRGVKMGCSAYVEIIRGTPLLIQLYLLYYGLPNLGIQLNAFAAAVLGMGMNYAAYEAEIYRAGLLAVAKGQHEAARSLGMTGAQTLWYIVLPQATRTILPPSTNDFIALFKDTSLVSIITVTELTRAYNLAATTSYRFLELGLMTALLYFVMSYPLALWSRRLEKQRHVSVH